jgi:hypothetical protein
MNNEDFFIDSNNLYSKWNLVNFKLKSTDHKWGVLLDASIPNPTINLSAIVLTVLFYQGY